MNKSKEDLEAEYKELLSHKKVDEQKCEEKEQQIYHYKKQVELVAVLKVDYIEEIELIKVKEAEKKEVRKANIKNLEETIRRETNDQNAILLEKTEKIASLTKQIEVLSKPKVTSKQNKDKDENIAVAKKLEGQIELIKNELSEIEFNIEEVQQLNEDLEQNNLEVSNTINNILESLEYKVQELKEAKDSIRISQEEMLQLKLDLESLKNKPLDIDKKGNSLFGEVEDSRLKTEHHLLRLIKRCNELKSDLSNKLKQMVDVLNQNMELYNQLEAFESYDEKYEEILEMHQTQEINLESQIEELKQAVLLEQVWAESNQPSYAVEYANNVFKSKWTEVEKLRQALDKQSKKKLDTFIKIKEAGADLRRRKSKVQQLRICIDMLENMLLELQLQQNPFAQYSDQNFDCFVEYFEKQDHISTRKRSVKHSSISSRATINHCHSGRLTGPFEVNNDATGREDSRIGGRPDSCENNLFDIDGILDQLQSSLTNVPDSGKVDNTNSIIQKNDTTLIKQVDNFD